MTKQTKKRNHGRAMFTPVPLGERFCWPRGRLRTLWWKGTGRAHPQLPPRPPARRRSWARMRGASSRRSSRPRRYCPGSASEGGWDSRRKLTDSSRGESPRSQHGTACWDKQPMRRYRLPAVEPRMSRLGKAGKEATSGASIGPASKPVMDNESERMYDASAETKTPRQFGSERCGHTAGGTLVPSCQLGTRELRLSIGMDL